MSDCGKQKHSTATGTEGHSEICDEIPKHFTEQYGRGTQGPSGPLFLSRRGQDLCHPSHGDAPEHTEESTFRENAKGLSGGRHRNPQNINGKAPSNPCANPTGIFTTSGSRDHASNEQPSNDEGDGRECIHKQSDQVLDDGILRC